MMIDSPVLLRAAGYSALVAFVALIGAGVTLALFFGGAGSGYGPLNDIFSAVALVGLVLPIVAVLQLVGDRAGGWLAVVSVLAVAGALIAAIGQVLLVVGVIDLQASFMTGGIGIVPVLVWAAVLGFVSLRLGLLPDHLGWLVVAVLALSLVTAIGSAFTTGPLLWVAALALLVALAGWLGDLSVTLSRAT